MKTIKQKEHRDIYINYDEKRFYIDTESDKITVENESIPDLIQALLPEGKAIIDVPKFERYEYVRYGYAVEGEYCIDFYGDITEWVLEERRATLSFIYRKKQEPFVWPEHLPDGTKLEFFPDGELWDIHVPCKQAGVSNRVFLTSYNLISRPEDRITIPDWLENEPRTIIKGEE